MPNKKKQRRRARRAQKVVHNTAQLPHQSSIPAAAPLKFNWHMLLLLSSLVLTTAEKQGAEVPNTFNMLPLLLNVLYLFASSAQTQETQSQRQADSEASASQETSLFQNWQTNLEKNSLPNYIQLDDFTHFTHHLTENTINKFDSDTGNTPLIQAIIAEQIDTVELLINKGADINLKRKAIPHKKIVAIYPFFIALTAANPAMAELLLEKNVDVNIFDDENYTPLHIAIHYSPHLLEKIISKSNQVNLPNNKGDTPLFIATLADRPDLIAILLQYGADLAIRESSGKDIFTYAKTENHTHAANFLEKFKQIQDFYDNNDFTSADAAAKMLLTDYPQLEDRFKYEKAKAQLNSKDEFTVKEGKETVIDLIKKYPNNDLLRIALGKYYLNHYDFINAKKNYRIALALQPNNINYKDALSFINFCLDKDKIYTLDNIKKADLTIAFSSKISPDIFFYFANPNATSFYAGNNFTQQQADEANSQLNYLLEIGEPAAIVKFCETMLDTLPNESYFAHSFSIIYYVLANVNPHIQEKINLYKMALAYSIRGDGKLNIYFALTVKNLNPLVAMRALQYGFYYTLYSIMSQTLTQKRGLNELENNEILETCDNFITAFEQQVANNSFQHPALAINAQVFVAIYQLITNLDLTIINEEHLLNAKKHITYLELLNKHIDFSASLALWKNDCEENRAINGIPPYIKNSAKELIDDVNEKYAEAKKKYEHEKSRENFLSYILNECCVLFLLINTPIISETAARIIIDLYFYITKKRSPSNQQSDTSKNIPNHQKEKDFLKTIFKDLIDPDISINDNKVATLRMLDNLNLLTTYQEISDETYKILSHNRELSTVAIDSASLEKIIAIELKKFNLKILNSDEKISKSKKYILIELKNFSESSKDLDIINYKIKNVLLSDNDEFKKLALLYRISMIIENKSLLEKHHKTLTIEINECITKINDKINHFNSAYDKLETNSKNDPNGIRPFLNSTLSLLSLLKEKKQKYETFIFGLEPYCKASNIQLWTAFNEQIITANNLLKLKSDFDELQKIQAIELIKANKKTIEDIEKLLNTCNDYKDFSNNIANSEASLNSGVRHYCGKTKTKNPPSIIPIPSTQTTSKSSPKSSSTNITNSNANTNHPSTISPSTSSSASNTLPKKDFNFDNMEEERIVSTINPIPEGKEEITILPENVLKKIRYLETLWDDLKNLVNIKTDDITYIKSIQLNQLRLMLRGYECIIQCCEITKTTHIIIPEEIKLLRHTAKYLLLYFFLDQKKYKDFQPTLKSLINTTLSAIPLINKYWLIPLKNNTAFSGVIDFSNLYKKDDLISVLKIVKKLPQATLIDLSKIISEELFTFNDLTSNAADETIKKLYSYSVIALLSLQGIIFIKLTKEEPEEEKIQEDLEEKSIQNISLYSLFNAKHGLRQYLLDNIQEQDAIELCDKICLRFSHFVNNDEFTSLTLLLNLSRKIAALLPEVINSFELSSQKDQTSDYTALNKANKSGLTFFSKDGKSDGETFEKSITEIEELSSNDLSKS